MANELAGQSLATMNGRSRLVLGARQYPIYVPEADAFKPVPGATDFRSAVDTLSHDAGRAKELVVVRAADGSIQAAPPTTFWKRSTFIIEEYSKYRNEFVDSPGVSYTRTNDALLGVLGKERVAQFTNDSKTAPMLLKYFDQGAKGKLLNTIVLHGPKAALIGAAAGVAFGVHQLRRA